MLYKIKRIIVFGMLILGVNAVAQEKTSAIDCKNNGVDCARTQVNRIEGSSTSTVDRKPDAPTTNDGIIGYKGYEWGDRLGFFEGLRKIDSCQYLLTCYELGSSGNLIKKKIFQFSNNYLVNVLVEYADDLSFEDYKKIETDLISQYGKPKKSTYSSFDSGNEVGVPINTLIEERVWTDQDGEIRLVLSEAKPSDKEMKILSDFTYAFMKLQDEDGNSMEDLGMDGNGVLEMLKNKITGSKYKGTKISFTSKAFSLEYTDKVLSSIIYQDSVFQSELARNSNKIKNEYGTIKKSENGLQYDIHFLGYSGVGLPTPIKPKDVIVWLESKGIKGVKTKLMQKITDNISWGYDIETYVVNGLNVVYNGNETIPKKVINGALDVATKQYAATFGILGISKATIRKLVELKYELGIPEMVKIDSKALPEKQEELY